MTWPIPTEQVGAGFGALTDRERQIVALICEGLEREVIARRLGISVRTADAHRHRALRKVGVANGVQLLRAAILAGFASMHDGTTAKGTP